MAVCWSKWNPTENRREWWIKNNEGINGGTLKVIEDEIKTV
jgi:hypothetical protein